MDEQMTNVLTGLPLNNAEVQQVANAARKLYQLVRQVKSMEEDLERITAEATKYQTEILPSMMEQFGLAELKLANGYKLSISPFYSGSIPPVEGKNADPERRVKCFTWLREHNFGSLIKTEVKVVAGQGDEKMVKRVTALLKKSKVPFVQADNVHHMTLKAFIREQCEGGTPPPEELFKTFVGKKAVVEAPK